MGRTAIFRRVTFPISNGLSCTERSLRQSNRNSERSPFFGASERKELPLPFISNFLPGIRLYRCFCSVLILVIMAVLVLTLPFLERRGKEPDIHNE